MQIIHEIFGQGSDLTMLQMAVRAILIFFIALVLIRFTGMRMFGIKSAFDICVTIIFGAVLARAIVGASPFVPTIVASAAIMAVHKIIGSIRVKNDWVSHLVKGTAYSLYKDGQLNKKNVDKCLLSHGDIMEEVRLNLHQNDLEGIDEIFMERNGKISFIKKTD
ncbi:MAG TPA: YetF domain-containing protein [Hanamia sp.]